MSNFGPDEDDYDSSDDYQDEKMADLWDEYGPDSQDDPGDENWDTAARYDD